MSASVSGTDATPNASPKMLRRALAALGATSLIMAIVFLPSAIAGAATQTVTITAHGYVPISSSIATGDSISFVNGDVSAHQIVFNAKTGVTCIPNPLVLQPTASGTCTFQSPGNYSYSDPNIKGKTFTGTVVVAKAPPVTKVPPVTKAPLSVALAMSPGVAVYGHAENLSGTTSDQSSGQSVLILAQSCGQTTATAVGTATTTTGGAFSFQRQPLNNTTYSVKVKNATSNSVLSQVFPWEQLKKTSLHHFSLRVSAAASFAGKYATFQRYNSSLRRWVNVKTVTLRTNSSGVTPTVVSSAAFTSTVARPQKVRTVLGAGQVGACYAPGFSNVIYS
jgi:plastocyanin